jgi:ATP-dependent Clp protease adaptor protein ClpS
MSPESSPPDAVVSTRPKSREKSQTRRFPPYHVILENDDHHSVEFVIGTLQKALGMPLQRAFEFTMQAHNTGRAVVWTGPREVAELKAEQIQTFHETRPNGENLGPLGCCIEPAPGG